MKNPLKAPATQPVLATVFQKTLELYWKTHATHWNIQCEDFASIHKLLEEQYTDMWESLDGIAEHMRALGMGAPNRSPAVDALPFGTARAPFIKDLIKDQEAMIVVLRDGIRKLDELNDLSGADFLTERLAAHEKMAWMLRASL